MTRDQAVQTCGSMGKLLEALGIAGVTGAEEEVLRELETIDVTMHKALYVASRGLINAGSFESPMAAIVSLFKDQLWGQSPMLERTWFGQRWIPHVRKS